MLEPLFDKAVGWRLYKKYLAQVIYCVFFVIFKKIDIVEHLRTAAIENKKNFWKIYLKELVFW